MSGHAYRFGIGSRLGPGALAAAVLLLLPAARADERILSFHSDITVHADSSMTVTERIRVRAEGKQIRRGIYRDFPTRYRGRFGNRVAIGFEIRGVRRDGKKSPYHTQRIRNGVRIKIGHPKVFLKTGEYTYELTYRTTRQLGFFRDHDELYWNVTGNDWAFPIDEARATVALPAGVDPRQIEIEGYTGRAGSKAAALECSLDRSGRAQFRTTARLGRQEGLTIVVGWPKGHVREPTRAERTAALFTGNPAQTVALGGLLLMLGYYLVAWAAVGRDPEKGTIIPLFKPPEGVSPAAARFLTRMGYDARCFAAALINLAVKGRVRLEEKDGEYTVQRVAGGDGLSKGEDKVFKKLVGSRQSFTFKQSRHTTVRSVLEALKDALAAEYDKRYFVTNRKFLVPGIVLAVLSVVGVAVASRAPEVGFFCLWLSIWTIGVVFLLRQVVAQWRGALNRGSLLTAGGAVFTTLFALPFVGAEIFVGVMFAMHTSPLTALALIGMLVVTCVFSRLLKAPTRRGRKLMDELEGFRDYLGVAETDRLAALHPPDKTPELFEAYLPYALALGVEQHWAEKFADVLAAAGREPGRAGYAPAWYASSAGRTFAPADLAGSVGGALTSAVAASSTAPGSSSGGGGGGSSGGGGGGGGGGGW